MRVPISKSRPVWEKRSQVQRCSVIGIVSSDNALIINKYRPAQVRSHGVEAQAFRSSLRILWSCVFKDPRRLARAGLTLYEVFREQVAR